MNGDALIDADRIDAYRTEADTALIAGNLALAGLYLLNRPERLVVSDFYVGVVDLLPWIPVSHPWHGLSLDEVVRALASKYLVLQDEISAELKSVTNTLAAGKYVAVHVRGSDKIVELAILEQANSA